MQALIHACAIKNNIKIRLLRKIYYILLQDLLTYAPSCKYPLRKVKALTRDYALLRRVRLCVSRVLCGKPRLAVIFRPRHWI